MEKTGINKKRRKYDESFKMELLKMVKSGRSVAEVSRTMGIGENLLYKWRSEENGQEKPVELEINAEIEHLRKQLKQAEIERDILKKSDRRSGLSYFRSGNVTKTYEIVLELSLSYQVRLLCTILEISFSSFYAWKRAESHILSQTKATLSKKVKEVFEEHRNRYGAVRISKELQSQGIKIGRHQTQTLMKKQSLVAIQRQRPTA